MNVGQYWPPLSGATSQAERLWQEFGKAAQAHGATPSYSTALRLIASYARFCEAFDSASAKRNVQIMIWRLEFAERQSRKVG